MLFHDLRRDADGNERPDFPLNQPAWRDAKILVAGRNFGGGSSREAAVYALYDAGIRCVIAPSFGDIFAQNAVKNGLLTAVLPEADADELGAAIAADPELPVTVDLEQQTIARGNRSFAFTIDPVSRNQLLNGWDDIDLTDSNRDRIAAFKAADRERGRGLNRRSRRSGFDQYLERSRARGPVESVTGVEDILQLEAVRDQALRSDRFGHSACTASYISSSCATCIRTRTSIDSMAR